MKAQTIAIIENQIQYVYQNKQLLIQALTHSSYANENGIKKTMNNERLEFLGDAVLEIITSEYLFHHYPDLLEGELTKMRASMVCEPTLAAFAKKIKLGDFILLGKGEAYSGGKDRASVLSDGVESIIGSLYLDGGIEAAKAFVVNLFLKNLNHKRLFVDSKTHLQEWVQSYSEAPLVYAVVRAIGPDHSKVFEVSVSHEGNVIGIGTGKSKKAAEQEAAFNAIKTMEEKL